VDPELYAENAETICRAHFTGQRRGRGDGSLWSLRVRRNHRDTKSCTTTNEGPREHQRARGDTARMILPFRAASLQDRISGIDWLCTSIVHDLRNPLGAVFTNAEMLMEIDPASTQGKRLATNIYRAAGRMRKLLADLGRVRCGNESRSEICKIHDVVTAALETARPAAEMQSIQILHDVPDDLEIPLERYGARR
jgi:signal transduction histidine kinase